MSYVIQPPAVYSPLSPTGSFVISPFSVMTPVDVNPVTGTGMYVNPLGQYVWSNGPSAVLPTSGFTTGYVTNGIEMNVVTGLGDNYIIQKNTTEWFKYRALDKWLYHDLSYLLKYLRVSGGEVHVVKSKEEYKSNDISNDDKSDVKKKIKYIEDEYLTSKMMKFILEKVVTERYIEWPYLTQKESLIEDIVEKYLKKAFRRDMEK
jgi:hypothetical protein